MKLTEWFERNKRQPGDSHGERVRKSVRDHYRNVEKLPRQKQACLISWDGDEVLHEIDLQRDGEPQEVVKVTRHGGEKIPAQREYKLCKEKETPDYLVYIEV